MLQTIVRAPRLVEDIEQGIRLARMHGKEISPAKVARVLKDAGVNYVIVGCHAANGYTGRPRATIGVDVIVQFPKMAAKVIAAAFPELEVQDTLVVTRFKSGGQEAIDLMKPVRSKLWRRLLKEAREVKIDSEYIRIPHLEGVLTAKYPATVSPHRRNADQLIDGGDFARMVEANEKIDLKLVGELAELVYAGGGKELLKLVNDARAGRRLEY